jgi:hypothetical protein
MQQWWEQLPIPDDEQLLHAVPAGAKVEQFAVLHPAPQTLVFAQAAMAAVGIAIDVIDAAAAAMPTR